MAIATSTNGAMLTPGTARPMPSTPASSRTEVDGGNRRSITATRPRPAIAARLTSTSRRSDQAPRAGAAQGTAAGRVALAGAFDHRSRGRLRDIDPFGFRAEPPGASRGRDRDGPPTEADDGKHQERHQDREEAERSLDVIGGEPLRLEGRDLGRHLLDAAHEIEQRAVAELRRRFGEVVVERSGLGDRTPDPVLLCAGDEVSFQRQAAHRRAIRRDPDDRHDVTVRVAIPIEPLWPAFRDRDLRRAGLGLHLERGLDARRGKDRGESPLGVGNGRRREQTVGGGHERDRAKPRDRRRPTHRSRFPHRQRVRAEEHGEEHDRDRRDRGQADGRPPRPAEPADPPPRASSATRR